MKLGWHFLLATLLAGLTYFLTESAGTAPGTASAIAIGVFIVYWFGWIACADGNFGDWF